MTIYVLTEYWTYENDNRVIAAFDSKEKLDDVLGKLEKNQSKFQRYDWFELELNKEP